MAFLFKATNKVVYPNAETLLISPFKEIWKRDKTKNKEKALEEFTYIEFMTSMKKSNPYRQYPEDRKEEVIRKDIIKQKDWEPDDLVKAGIEKVIEFQKNASTTYNFYMSAKRAAEKMQNFFNNVNVNERGGKFDTPIWKPRDITSALNDTGKVLANLKDLEKKVEEELFEETKNKSGKEVSPFADPNSLV